MSSSRMFSLDRPKSVNRTLPGGAPYIGKEANGDEYNHRVPPPPNAPAHVPFSSSNTFSGFKSLQRVTSPAKRTRRHATCKEQSETPRAQAQPACRSANTACAAYL